MLLSVVVDHVPDLKGYLNNLLSLLQMILLSFEFVEEFDRFCLDERFV
jgi:hypothetical protein